jgi:catechol 2,3-dioxygenase-like lactoylglutathione lyase family enzyme
MKTSKEIGYRIHHLCIYDGKPREHMWPYLRWNHSVTGYFFGATYHIADEGHADYTFLGCGGNAFQIQLEAPPFQFKYEQGWFKDHGNAYNHICWVVADARASFEQLQAAGATVVQEYTEFPTYNGFVMKDPEGRWIEIMEYTHDTFRVPELAHQPAGTCGLEMAGFVALCRDPEASARWYEEAMDLKIISNDSLDGRRVITMSDADFDADSHPTMMILTTPQSAAERTDWDRHGPMISHIVYQAADPAEAWDQAVEAGFEAVEPLHRDALTGATLGTLREPSGNLVLLRDPVRP